MHSLENDGFQIIRSVFNTSEIITLRKEADRIAQIEDSVCVRRLRDKSDHFSSLATSPHLLELLPDDYFPVRSILFDKTSTENWPVAWHQDLTIAVKEKVDLQGFGPWSIKDGITHVQPPVQLLQQMLTLRIHLDDTPETNGALKVISESHLKGKLTSSDIKDHTKSSEICCVCESGDVLIMSPLILHASSRSQKPERRRIIHFEYAPLDLLDSKLEWSESN